MISVVMPSYLGNYEGSASNKEDKFIRAIQSLIDNTYQQWELIVVADGCELTNKLLKNFNDKRIRSFEIPKQDKWSGLVRNIGISKAKYEWIAYLDTDDMFGVDHLQVIMNNVAECDWVWFNELSYDISKSSFVERECDIHRRGKCGTSTISHKKEIALWNKSNDYGQDWAFIKNLKKGSTNYKKIPTPSYLVCHVPHLLDV